MSNRLPPRLIAAAAIAGAITSSLAGCSTTQSAGLPQATIRPSVETAPTDLQLLCAAEAANRLGVDSSSVLPTGSAVLQPSLYRVDLSVSGAPAVCTIDDAGAIHSIES